MNWKAYIIPGRHSEVFFPHFLLRGQMILNNRTIFNEQCTRTSYELICSAEGLNNKPSSSPARAPNVCESNCTSFLTHWTTTMIISHWNNFLFFKINWCLLLSHHFLCLLVPWRRQTNDRHWELSTTWGEEYCTTKLMTTYEHLWTPMNTYENLYALISNYRYKCALIISAPERISARISTTLAIK